MTKGNGRERPSVAILLVAACVAGSCTEDAPDDAVAGTSASDATGTESVGATENEADDASSATTSGDSGGAGPGSSTGADPSAGPDAPQIPDNEFCQVARQWGPWQIEHELTVLELVNQQRSEGYDCNTGGVFGPAGPLTLEPALMCAARVHSYNMSERGFFDHLDPDGVGPGDRIYAAGYQGAPVGENIAWGSATPQAVVAAWLASDGHCANMMKPDWDELGVGFYGSMAYWTQTFGTSP